jgi:hypothetical protein
MRLRGDAMEDLQRSPYTHPIRRDVPSRHHRLRSEGLRQALLLTPDDLHAEFHPVFFMDSGNFVAARDDFQVAFRVTGVQLASVPEPSPLALIGMIVTPFLVARAAKAWAGRMPRPLSYAPVSSATDAG